VVSSQNYIFVSVNGNVEENGNQCKFLHPKSILKGRYNIICMLVSCCSL